MEIKMTDSATTLKQAIDKLIEEKTFSLDALEAIKDLRDRVGKHEENQRALAEQLARASEREKLTSAKLLSAESELSALKANVSQVAAREAKIFEVEKNAAVNAAQSAVYDRVFQTVFRNTVVRENSLRSMAVTPQFPGGPNTMAMPESFTRETDPMGT